MEKSHGEVHYNHDRDKDRHYKPPCPPPPKKNICAEECGKIVIEKGPVNIFVNCCADGKGYASDVDE